MISFRLMLVTATAALGGLLFGYDTGFIGAMLVMPAFKEDFHITGSDKAAVSGNVVSTLQAGCFFGAIAMAYVTAKIGRRRALIICGALFNVGAIIQTVAKGKLGVLYGGRVISGLGVGAASMAAPTFIAEMSPKRVRGSLLTCYGFAIFFGICIAYWVDYACNQRLTGSKQWIVPVALQLVPGSALIFGTVPLKESPRWLIKNGHTDLAYKNLVFVREKDCSPAEIEEEWAEMVLLEEKEKAEASGRSFKEIFWPGNRNRFALAIVMMICQQLTGTLSFTYYAPTFFQAVGMSSSSAGLFATGVYGIVKAVCTMIYLIFFIEKVGRKISLMWGNFLMGASMLIIACLYATHKPIANSENISPYSYGMIVMIYFFCVGYSCSWGPIPWTYCSEIFPNRLREYGVTIAAATQWAFNYLFSKVIPYAIANIGWKVFLMFAIFNAATFVFTFFFVRETSGLSLEEMEELFGSSKKINVQQAEAIATSKIDPDDFLEDVEAESVKHPAVQVNQVKSV